MKILWFLDVELASTEVNYFYEQNRCFLLNSRLSDLFLPGIAVSVYVNDKLCVETCKYLVIMRKLIHYTIIANKLTKERRLDDMNL